MSTPHPETAPPARPHRLVNRIRERTLELLDQAAPLCAKHGANLPDPDIRLDLRGQAAGQALWQAGTRPQLRFNRRIADRHETDFLARTVTHEVAHLVTFACFGRTQPHGPEWRLVMAHFGVTDAARCHDYPLEAGEIRRQRRWAYRCDCKDHELSTTRHNRILRGARYHCRQCHAALRPAAIPDD